ncbi:MAG: double-stranded DNA-binding protein [Thaumarchaeota archaeon]|nr:double-stranded DNA-binding protein [Nitrososphaerota archaeon]
MSDSSGAAEGSSTPNPSETQEDVDMKMLNARRMVELRKRANINLARKNLEEQRIQREKNRPSDRDILLRALTDRGDEVLSVAERSYPKEMAILIPRLSALIKQGKVTSITGGELLQFLRSIGMRVSVSTTISVEDHGKFVSLADKLKKE